MLRGLLQRHRCRRFAGSAAYTHVLAWIPDALTAPPLNDKGGYWDLVDRRSWEIGDPPEADAPLLLLGSGAPQTVLAAWVRAVLGETVDLVAGWYELDYDAAGRHVWHREPLFYVHPVLGSGVGS